MGSLLKPSFNCLNVYVIKFSFIFGGGFEFVDPSSNEIHDVLYPTNINAFSFNNSSPKNVLTWHGSINAHNRNKV